jgi:hypothetical protein
MSPRTFNSRHTPCLEAVLTNCGCAVCIYVQGSPWAMPTTTAPTWALTSTMDNVLWIRVCIMRAVPLTGPSVHPFDEVPVLSLYSQVEARPHRTNMWQKRLDRLKSGSHAKQACIYDRCGCFSNCAWPMRCSAPIRNMQRVYGLFKAFAK